MTSTSMRTHQCGELRPEHIGQQVTLTGWVATRREHGEKLAFIDVRDHTGVTQAVVDNTVDVRSEYVVRVTGTVAARPAENLNEKLATGGIELQDCTVDILNVAEAPPFPVSERADQVAENTRLQYRFIDIRRERMQRNLRLRAAINSAIRTSMEDQGFVEVETPMLVPSTPEGAREFIVPSRQQPGSFYALPQSPQLFKQLLMVAGIDRYYQIARCLRDEDLRADRQYEFMQLDAEMSFVDQLDVHEAIGACVVAAAKAAGQDPGEIIKITWHEAMNRFGSDKPDLRFGMELTDLTDVFAATEFKAFAGAATIKGINAAGKADDYGRNKLDGMTDRAKQMGAKGLVWLKVAADGTLESPVAKFLGEAEQAALKSALSAQPGDLLLIVADQWDTTCEVLGTLRNDIGRPPVYEGPYRYLWVVDFPMFVGVDAVSGHPIPAHHPFTRPHPDDVHLLETDPMNVRSQAYDLVLNGWELGSGSIRIHEHELQARIFTILGISDEEAQKKFGFFLNPFRYGAPPHGGFAFGIDRLVAVLAGEENIREIIAFPK
ncbi:MAG: aspartate--tRNA ligase, partial [Actinomycetota bacterium]|nr:aspartate--tRNA ligase [Actinomycetota bacterium]